MYSSRFRRLITLLITGLACLVLTSQVLVAAPSAQNDLEGMILIGTRDDAISIYVPETWTFRSLPANQVYVSTLVAAENEALLDDVTAYQLGNQTSGASSGHLALVTRLAVEFWQPYAPSADDAVYWFADVIAASFPVYEEFSVELENGYEATVFETIVPELNARGYIGMFAASSNLYLFQLMASPPSTFDEGSEILESIGDSISVPAAPGAIKNPNQAQPTAPAPTDIRSEQTEEIIETEEAVLQVTASDGVLSIDLPESWLYRDLTAESDLFIYGSSEDALNARLFAFRPDLVEVRPAISGLGGVIALYNAADVGVSPDAPDVEPLMQQVIGNLSGQGYSVVDEGMSFGPEDAQGRIVTIGGDEVGYLALIPFGDQIAYVTATGTSAATDADMVSLISLIASVSVPAAPEETPEPAATPSGLSGLGGLNTSPTATPQAGLGGLGILGGDETEEEVIDSEATEAAN